MLCQTRHVPRALLSVYDKTGIVDFARALNELGWDLLASGGTAQALRDASLSVVDIADVTGYPAILGHRVVTLHPAVHGGILADTSNTAHLDDLGRHNIEPIDLVCVGLYPFSSNPGIEMIDIGGPSLLRGAAKNHARVAVVTDTSQYTLVIEALREHGVLSAAIRRELAARAFAVTAAYDAQVAAWFADGRILGLVSHSLVSSLCGWSERQHCVTARIRINAERGIASLANAAGGVVPSSSAVRRCRISTFWTPMPHGHSCTDSLSQLQRWSSMPTRVDLR